MGMKKRNDCFEREIECVVDEMRMKRERGNDLNEVENMDMDC